MGNEAVTVAKKEREKDVDGLRTLSTGVRARIVPISQSVMQDAVGQVKEPPVPTWYNEAKEREEENPAHPDYQKAMEEYARKQNRVAFDVLAMFGIELEDGLPKDDKWLRKLELMALRGAMDLGEFDLEDEVHREFLYKRYVAMGNEDIVLIGRMSGINPEDVARAADSFPGPETRDQD